MATFAPWALYQHDDGSHAAAPSADAATFTKGNPAWHRVGLVALAMDPATEGVDGPATRAARRGNDQLAALVRVFEQAESGNHSGALVCQRFLLGLYNGYRFPFDLTDLRRLDHGNHEACLQVLCLDHLPKAEVHVQLAMLMNRPQVFMSLVFERWGYDQGLKGRCKKAGLDGLQKALQAENARRKAQAAGAAAC